jgi:hypothetical protein
VDQSVRLEAGDQEGVQRLIQYFLRCPFSQARMIEVTEAGKVIYKTEHNAVGRFPDPGDDELLAGPARNFQVFDPLDFLAEVTQHIPDPGEHLIRYYGWYSNKTRGQRLKRAEPEGEVIEVSEPKPRRIPSKKWRELIKKVWEADPLLCPHCHKEMRMVALIDEEAVIERILRHLGLWEAGVRVDAARDPPAPAEPVIEPWLDLSACDAQAGDPFPDYDHEPVFAQN